MSYVGYSAIRSTVIDPNGAIVQITTDLVQPGTGPDAGLTPLDIAMRDVVAALGGSAEILDARWIADVDGDTSGLGTPSPTNPLRLYLSTAAEVISGSFTGNMWQENVLSRDQDPSINVAIVSALYIVPPPNYQVASCGKIATIDSVLN